MDFMKIFRRYIGIPLINRYYGIHYAKELSEVNRINNLNSEELKSYQLKKIKKLVRHAFDTVPYYHKEWTQIGFSPDDISSLDDFSQLPILTKTKIRENYKLLISDNSKDKELIESGTGGTTDSPILIYYDKKRARFKEAEMCFFREWFNWSLGDKVAFLWGAPQDIPHYDSLIYQLVNILTYNKLFLFSSLLNSDIMDKYIHKLNIFKPDIIQGYTNPLFILSKYICDSNKRVYSPKSIVLTAEPCLPVQRKIIEQAFNTEVFTFYGCREGGYVGCECKYHNGYHINSSSIYMEFLVNLRNSDEGELGNIVFTDLLNFDMPFIRYQIGDVGSPNNNVCKCGSSLPLMDFFAGRETDVFVTPQGDLIPGVSLCDRIIEDCKGIEQLQFIQDTQEELLVKIVKGKNYSEKDVKQLDERLFNYFQGRLLIKKDFVTEIPKEKSGKTRFCISNVRKDI